MKKLYLMICLSFFVLLFTGCSSVENVVGDFKDEKQVNITQEDIELVKRVTDPETYQSYLRKYNNITDKDLAIYYKKVISLNDEINKYKGFEEYDNPRIIEKLYSAEIKGDINKATKNMSFHLEQQDIDLYGGCDYKFTIENLKTSNYDVEPSVFFIVRDKLTKLPVDCGRIEFDMIKPGESATEEITFPLGELELVPNMSYLMPKKLIEKGLIFDTDILEDYPSKQFSNKKIPQISSGRIINDNVPKTPLSKYEKSNSLFKKDTRVVVLFLDKDGRYLVSDGTGNYAYVDKQNISIDGPEIKFNPLNLDVVDIVNAIL